MSKPSLFVGSSTEGLEIARAIQDQLMHDVDVTLWSDSSFELGKATLEALLDFTQRFDFAVLVFTPDDIAKIRGKDTLVPRDNVVFEFGLFMGRLGRDRTFAVCDSTLPMWNDLAGITVAVYDKARCGGNLMAALGPACNQIRRSICRQGLQQSKKSLPEFWRPFIGEESLIIISHFDMPEFEASGVIGFGDAMALIEIQTYCESIGLHPPKVRGPDQLAPNELSKNLILLGGPDANRLTKEINTRIACRLTADVSAVRDLVSDAAYCPKHDRDKLLRDVGVIIETANPFASDKRVLLLFGCYGYGTWAAARFAKSSSFLDAPELSTNEGIECILQTEVIQNNPYAIKAVVLRSLQQTQRDS